MSHPVIFSNTEVGVMVLLSLVVLKFVDRWVVSKQESKLTNIIKEEAAYFHPNLERTRKIEAKVIDIQGHMVGNNEILREISKTNLINAETQKQITHLLEKHNDDSKTIFKGLEEKIDRHKDDCKNQYHQLREIVK